MANNSGPGYHQHPEQKITVQQVKAKAEVLLNQQVLATSNRCLKLLEGRYPDVYYLPKADVVQSLLVPSDTQTYCPFKGTAKYWHISLTNPSNGQQELVEDALWGDPEPYDEVLELADYIAFDPNKVDSIDIAEIG